MTAVREVQNAGYWVSHDAQMAQSIDDNPTAPEILGLAWVGWEYDDCGNTCIDAYKILYTHDTDSGKLWRNQRITTTKYNSSGQLIETTYTPSAVGWDTTPIAQHITSISIPPMAGNKLTVTVTASVGEAEEERTYEVVPRPDS